MSGIPPFRVLRAKPLWIANGLITGVLALLFTVFYVGANIDPVDHMKDLPVGLVNADKGAAVGGRQVNLGAQISDSITKSTASGDKIDWKVMNEKEMKEELGKGKLYGALVVPADFTSSTVALTGAATTTGTPARPTLTVLTNQSAGSVGSGLARTATTQAAESASLQVGRELNAQGESGQAKLPAAARVLLADPAAVTVKDGHPLDAHSGLGLTAFYYALVLVVCGMLSANVISGQVDHALGYTHNDMGPLRLHRPLIRATRVQTLAVAGTLMAGLSLVMGTLVMAGAVGLMGMDASHLPLLWLYSVCAIAVTGIGALTLLAVFGTPGMLVVTLVFIGMAVPTANATTPLQALPAFYRFLAEFEPLRQITGGIRAILYYDAQADAGLTRGWVMMAVGLAAAALFGLGVTGWYDRKGLHRIPAGTEPEKTAAPA
jgi:YhgE/Pip-like protein